MKAEAPEKIYCGNNGYGNLSYSNQPFPNAVEYTRTEAFIEKAVKWLENNLQGIVGGSIYIEDFKEYLKK